VTIWLPVMFRDELPMLQMRLEETQGWPAHHVIAEATQTHRGVPKPLCYQENADRFAPWADRIIHVVADLPDLPPWGREHYQRDQAWPVIDARADDTDIVIIGDVDEIPSPELLSWNGPGAISARMRTTLFAVDWEVPQSLIPPTCVAATVSCLRGHGGSLAAVRDSRNSYPVLADGGWHFSWTGGPEWQREKLVTATCHVELLDTTEGDLIASGERWRTGCNGEGHHPVVPVEVDQTWPKMIRERRCPEEWRRPRGHT